VFAIPTYPVAMFVCPRTQARISIPCRAIANTLCGQLPASGIQCIDARGSPESEKMSLKSTLAQVLPEKPRSFLRQVFKSGSINEFAFDERTSVSEDIEAKYGPQGDLLDFFIGNEKNIVHKWHHYIPIYEKYFARYRGRPLRFLEIGVSKGGSLQVWRKYFGPDAIIFGIDINEDCLAFQGQHGQVRIGSQDDIGFLNSVVAEMGGVDVVLDDGSHVMKHIETSLSCLLPQLSEDGVYMIEDLHSAYWTDFGGGMYAKANFFNLVRSLTDDMHHWYHGGPMKHPEISGYCRSIHVYDSIAVIEKGQMHKPVHSQIK
jgi:hypothetical protein